MKGVRTYYDSTENKWHNVPIKSIIAIKSIGTTLEITYKNHKYCVLEKIYVDLKTQSIDILNQ